MVATFVGSLVADMSANSAAFGRDMRDSARTLRSTGAQMNRALAGIDRGFQRVRRGIGRAARGMFGFRGAIAAVASPAAFGYLVRQSMLATDELAKTADAANFSIETLSALEFQASQTGVSYDQLSTALRFYIRGVGDLEARTGTLFTFLSRYDEGLLSNIRNARDQEEALRILADAIEREEDATVRASLASAAFGRQGSRLVRTFREGAGGIDAFRERAEALDLVMREDLARSTEAANDEIDALVRQMRMQFNVAVAENAEGIRNLTAEIAAFVPQLIEWAEGALQALDRFSDKPMRLSLTFDGLGDQLNMVGSLSAELEQLQERARAGRANRFNMSGFSARVEDIVGRERMDEIRDELWERTRADNPGARAIPMDMALQAYRDELREVASRIREARAEFRETVREQLLEDDETGDGTGSGIVDAVDDGFSNFLDRMQTAVEEVRAEREMLAGEAQAYYDATRTAAEGYTAELERINGLEAGGFFADLGGAETAGRARIQILTDMAEASGNLQAAFEELQRLSEEEIISAAQFKEARAELMGLVEDVENVETIYDDIRKAGEGVFRTALDEVHDFSMGMQDLEETVGDVITSIRSHFQRLMLQRFLIQPLENAFNSFLGNISAGKGGGLGSIFGGGGKSAGKPKVPGFARGGSGVVGGVGGTDSKLVMFRATPGESVDIQTPSQQRETARGSAGRSGDVIVNFNFLGGSDAQSIRRARGEIAADIGRVVRQAQRNL